jgi:7-cyano-7-deazaguanine synthase in queuosine biosynthesis
VKRLLVLCENPAREAYEDLQGTDCRPIELRAFEAPANLRFQSLGDTVYECLTPLAADLARVGAYVFSADRLVPRGDVDEYGKEWIRSFTFVVPVYEPDLWNSPAVKDALVGTLSFLSEDQYDFRFIRGGPFGRGESSLFRDPWVSRADSVALFSGGLDSLAGVVWDHVERRRCPILVSHRPQPGADARQRRLVELLRQRFTEWNVVHAPAWINFRERSQREITQRSRSFLYLSLAAAVALQFGKSSIAVYENGVVSINLPITAETVGARVTRTTHPRFIQGMVRFLRALSGTAITIETPFSWLTKKEVALRLAKVGHADLIQASTSCSHTFMVSRAEPHCGVCSQCLDRRVALEAAELGQHDTPYVHNMYTSSLGGITRDPSARSMALGYVRTHSRIAELTPEQFVAEYPQVLDAADIPPADPEDTVQRIYNLYQRQAADVRSALLKADMDARDARIDGLLPKDCLLRMLYEGEHRKNPLSRLARRIAVIASECLPLCFPGKQPTNEAAVRDALDSQLAAGREELDKEFPIVRFAMVKASRPDLSAAGGRLFVEVKYPRPSRKLGAIGDEIAADITQYRDADAAVLFIVYDPNHAVRDRRGFVRELEKHPEVFACVV